MVTACKVPADTNEKSTLAEELEELREEVRGRIEKGEITEKITEALRDGTLPIAVRHRVDGVLAPEKEEVIRAWRKKVEAELLEGVRSE